MGRLILLGTLVDRTRRTTIVTRSLLCAGYGGGSVRVQPAILQVKRCCTRARSIKYTKKPSDLRDAAQLGVSPLPSVSPVERLVGFFRDDLSLHARVLSGFDITSSARCRYSGGHSYRFWYRTACRGLLRELRMVYRLRG